MISNTSFKTSNLLRWAGMIVSVVTLVQMTTACPKCESFPVRVALTDLSGSPYTGEVESIEYARNGGDFKPCSEVGSQGEASCGKEMMWGCTGPDESQVRGEYVVRAVVDGEEWQGSGVVGDITCTEIGARIEIVIASQDE